MTRVDELLDVALLPQGSAGRPGVLSPAARDTFASEARRNSHEAHLPARLSCFCAPVWMASSAAGPHWPDQPRALPNQETFASEAVLKLLFDFEHAWGRGTLLAVDDPPGPWETRYGVGGSFSCTALLDPRLLRGASCPGMYPSVGSLRSV